MSPLELTCRVCMSKPSYLCVDGIYGPMSTFHPERLTDAAAMTHVVDPISEQAFEKSVDESMKGLL